MNHLKKNISFLFLKLINILKIQHIIIDLVYLIELSEWWYIIQLGLY